MNAASIAAAISVFMSVWQLIGMLMPLVKQLIQTAEALFPSGGQGATKLAWVREELSVAYSGLDGVVVSFGDLWPKIQSVIDLYVKVANNQGWSHPAVDPNITVASLKV